VTHNNLFWAEQLTAEEEKMKALESVFGELELGEMRIRIDEGIEVDADCTFESESEEKAEEEDEVLRARFGGMELGE
jgi:hypothetical protein